MNSKRIHREQEVSLKDLKTFVNSIPAPVIMLDTSNDIIVYSQSWMTFFSVKDDIRGDSFSVHFQDLNFEEHIQKVIETGNSEKITSYEYFDNDRVKYLNINIDLWKIEVEKIGGVIVMLNDVTTEVETEKALKEHNEELKQFAYITTHDVKSPITNINSFLHFLKEDKSIQDPSSLQAIHWIEKSIDKANTKINDLVKVIEQRESSVLLEKIDLRPLIDDLKKSITVDDLSLSTFLKVEFIGEPYLVSSKKQLITILENLLTNGIRYRNTLKTLELSITIDTTSEKQSVISVKDNGVGIDLKAHKKRIFEMFKRANDVIDGNGLGLYLTRQACDQLKGRIEVFSEVGDGTNFMVFLPKKLNDEYSTNR